MQSGYEQVRVEKLRSGNNENMARVADRVGELRSSGAGGFGGTGNTFANSLSMKPHASVIAFIIHALLWAARVIQKKII